MSLHQQRQQDNVQGQAHTLGLRSTLWEGLHLGQQEVIRDPQSGHVPCAACPVRLLCQPGWAFLVL